MSAAKRPSPTGKPASEMAADEARSRDSAVITVTCLHCPKWSYAGPAGEARKRSAAHRKSKHPKAVDRRGVARARREDEQRARAARAARDVDAQDPGPRAAGAPDVDAEAAAAATTADDGAGDHAGVTRKWTRETAIAAVREEADRLGHPPTVADARRSKCCLPSQPTATELFGSWADLIVAAGFERPNKRTRYPIGPLERAAVAVVSAARKADRRVELADAAASRRDEALDEVQGKMDELVRALQAAA